MKKFFVIMIIFFLSLIVFMPKKNLYYTLLNVLKNERIIIQDASLHDRLLFLDADKLSVYYDGIKSVDIDSMRILPFIFFDSIKLKHIRPSADLKKMFSFSADEADITYGVWNYKNVNIKAKGDFGSLDGNLDLKNGNIKVILKPSLEFKKSPMLGEYFRKSDKGYVYESKIY